MAWLKGFVKPVKQLFDTHQSSEESSDDEPSIRHNLSLGTRTSEDVTLYEEDMRRGDKFLERVSGTFFYQCRKGEEITAVLAEDRWDDDTGGSAERVSGGVGQQHVEIKVTSQWSRGFHFKFYVYGKRLAQAESRKADVSYKSDHQAQRTQRPPTGTGGQSNDPATSDLYSQTYDQIVKRALAGSSENFQLMNPMQDWTWAPASAGFIDPQTYSFVGQVPKWSDVYAPSGIDMHQAYLQVLSLRDVVGNGTNTGQQMEANKEVAKKQSNFIEHQKQAYQDYAEYKKTLPAGIPERSYTDWMADHWQDRLDADKLAYTKALETLALVVYQKNPGLKKAIDNATLPQDPQNRKPGFLKVLNGTKIGVRPAYIFDDPKVWVDRVTAQGGGIALTIELSASASSGSPGSGGGFFLTCGSGGWQTMDLAEDKTMKVSVTIKAFHRCEVKPDPAWYDSGLLKRLAVDNNWNPRYSTKGEDGKKPVFGKGGVLPRILTGIVVGYQPSIDITMSDATYRKYKEHWDASSEIRIGPFQIGGSGDESWSKNTDNKKFHVESKAAYPFIMGITFANLGE